MAEFLQLSEVRSYPLSTGGTADLIALAELGTGAPGSWVKAVSLKRLTVGTEVYVNALGGMRRGVVVATTRTRVRIALTTISAVAIGEVSGTVRVQTVVADPNYVLIEPPAEEMKTALSWDAYTAPEQLAEHQVVAETVIPEVVSDSVRQRPTDRLPLREGGNGSRVVRTLEKIWVRIRQTHSELPNLVIVTGSGMAGDNKWGHFRADGWSAGTERVHEMFIAGETLAKGPRQVLQTMLHEAAHCLARVRDIKDTTRQGRYHNGRFRKLGQEMGLDYPGEQADKKIGFSAMKLEPATETRYADLLQELEREIDLVVQLPSWLGGQGVEGGEQMPRDPKPAPTAAGSTNLKLVCGCEEPTIIRASRKVAEKLTVVCSDCGQAFTEAVS